VDNFAIGDPLPEPVPAPPPAPVPTPQPTDNGVWLWIGLIVLLLVMRGGCAGITIGSPPPYVSPKPTVLIVEDESVEGRKALVGEQDDIMRSNLADGIRKSVEAAGGELQVLGVKNTVTLDSDWAKAAWAVADKVHLPSIVAASPKAGVAPQPLPKTVAETKTLLAPILVK
jgi:hypothetical protein